MRPRSSTPREADVEPLISIDSTRRFATVNGEGETLGAGAADRIRGALAAEVVGVCQRALNMTLDYVKERKQFGVPVGSFQAVSHRCAQMLLHTESGTIIRVLRRLGGGRRSRAVARGGGAGRDRRGGRRSRGDGGGDPGPRRDRLHVGGGCPLALQAGAARRGVARRVRPPSGQAGPTGRGAGEWGGSDVGRLRATCPKRPAQPAVRRRRRCRDRGSGARWR